MKNDLNIIFAAIIFVVFGMIGGVLIYRLFDGHENVMLSYHITYIVAIIGRLIVSKGKMSIYTQKDFDEYKKEVDRINSIGEETTKLDVKL